MDTESYSRSWPSKLELRVVLGLLLDESLLCLGPWSAYLQPSPCDLMRDSALAFLVLAGLLSGSMGLPEKYPPISSPRIYLGHNFGVFVRLLFLWLLLKLMTWKLPVTGSKMNSCININKLNLKTSRSSPLLEPHTRPPLAGWPCGYSSVRVG